MKLINATEQTLFYSISSPGAGDCGTIDEQKTANLPGYNNKDNVRVAFAPSQATAFVTNIAQSGTGKVVTISIAVE